VQRYLGSVVILLLHFGSSAALPEDAEFCLSASSAELPLSVEQQGK
jgi:hypothetical protein